MSKRDDGRAWGKYTLKLKLKAVRLVKGVICSPQAVPVIFLRSPSTRKMMDMRTSKFSKEQIIGFLRQSEAGMPIKAIGRKHGFCDASFYKWRSKFGAAAGVVLGHYLPAGHGGRALISPVPDPGPVYLQDRGLGGWRAHGREASCVGT